jgi:transposase
MRIACRMTNATTDTHAEYIILLFFPLQQRLHQRTTVLRYTYIACLVVSRFVRHAQKSAEHEINPLSPELNPICYLLELLAHDFLHVTRIRVKSLTLRLLMSYIYIYDISHLRVNRSHLFSSMFINFPIFNVLKYAEEPE